MAIPYLPWPLDCRHVIPAGIVGSIAQVYACGMLLLPEIEDYEERRPSGYRERSPLDRRRPPGMTHSSW